MNTYYYVCRLHMPNFPQVKRRDLCQLACLFLQFPGKLPQFLIIILLLSPYKATDRINTATSHFWLVLTFHKREYCVSSDCILLSPKEAGRTTSTNMLPYSSRSRYGFSKQLF